MATVLKHFKGAGVVYLGGLDVGTADDVKVSGDEEKATLRNARTGEGNIASQSRLSGLELAITFYDFKPENLKRAFRGDIVTVAATPIVDEVLSLPASFTEDTLAATAKIIDTSVAPVVTGSGGTPTRVEGTDYEVVPSGIKALAGGGCVNGDLVDYTPKAGKKIRAFTQGGVELPVIIDGMNNVENNEEFVQRYWKWKPAPVTDLPIISDDDFASYTLVGELVADTTKAAGESQYFEHEAVN